MEKSSVSLHSLYVERPLFFKHDFKNAKTAGLIFLQRSWEWSLKKIKIKTFPPQGFGSHQDLVSGIHSSPVTCQKSQAFPPFPTRALRLAWNYSTHEAKPVQQPLHKASHHSLSNSLTQVHTHAANPSANPSVSSPPLRVCWFRHDSRASLHPLYIYSFVDASFLPCQAAGHAALLLIAPAGDGPPPGTCGRCRRQIALAGEGKTGLEISFWVFFLWKSSPVNNNNNDILLSFLINPQPSSFGWKSSGFPVRKRPQTNIVLRVILTYSCQADVLCTTVTVGCQSTTAFRHSAKLTATKKTSVNCESARAATCFLPQLVFIHPARLHFSLLWWWFIKVFGSCFNPDLLNLLRRAGW